MLRVRYGVAITVVLLSVILSYLFMMNLTVEMANHGLLFISSVGKAQAVCKQASQFVQKVLYVKIKGGSEVGLSAISKQIENVYSKATAQCGNLDIRLMLKPSEMTKEIKTKYTIDMILYDSELSKDISKLQGCVATLKQDCKVQAIDCQDSAQSSAGKNVETYENVALGGTFDRLHNGHKLLLSQAALRATKHVAVGVTDVNMIQSKTLWELIEPVEVRIKHVKNFLMDINPDLEYNVFPLKDLYGPTKDDPKYQLIVVSEETFKGAKKINEKRVEKGLNPMAVHVIQLAEDNKRHIEEETKISSSNQRRRLLGSLLKAPMPQNPNIPEWPYIIGLAGGIASGKTSLMKKIQAKGAAIINCDTIAHELYKPGLPLNRTISDNFGTHIITEAGEVDRKKLGQIVFSDKAQLDKLNSLLWPAILEEALRRARAFGEAGYRVVVMEAAVMVRAKWYNYCHQLWAVIVPHDEALKRIMERDNLTEEHARIRLQNLPSNTEMISHANVVFSPLWSYDYTQEQLDRAWTHLEEILAKRSSKL